MDFLTHLTLPLTVAYVIRRDLFPSPPYLLLGGFGLLSDFDKFLGMPGLLHSAVSLAGISLVVGGAERQFRGEMEYSLLIVCLIWSHLLLDLVDGGPVPLLYPFVESGIGLQYPVRTVFGEGLLGLRFEGSPVSLRTATPRPGHNTYGFVKGGGVASALAFLAVYLGLRNRPLSD
ncbi:metal-dependent hydrolase [Halorientalis halophila]|uniref:metal-dependent hydrolase n=1 Tax=Halorientalis halophila TaxID=3108499 RepID=UPI0030085880